MWNEFAANGFVTLPDSGVQVVASATKPSSTNVVWLQLDTLGRPTRVFFFAQGAWLSLHQQQPGMVILWTAALPNFATFDGGDANALSPISGPMWEEVVELRARFPIGAGTLPSGTVLAQGATGGQETQGGLIDHVHVTGRFLNNSSGDNASEEFMLIGDGASTQGSGRRIPGGGGGTPGSRVLGNLQDQTGDYTLTSGVLNPPGGSTSLPPYLVVYFLRRTSRQFFSVT
jgi:hypothetical protein